jgi:hypothetical protein
VVLHVSTWPDLFIMEGFAIPGDITSCDTNEESSGDGGGGDGGDGGDGRGGRVGSRS